MVAYTFYNYVQFNQKKEKKKEQGVKMLKLIIANQDNILILSPLDGGASGESIKQRLKEIEPISKDCFRSEMKQESCSMSMFISSPTKQSQ